MHCGRSSIFRSLFCHFSLGRTHRPAEPPPIVVLRTGKNANSFLADYECISRRRRPMPYQKLPDRGNYIIVACLFIAFGVVAAVCGWISNIYVQINEMSSSHHS
jgi:hypothetical protein